MHDTPDLCRYTNGRGVQVEANNKSKGSVIIQHTVQISLAPENNEVRRNTGGRVIQKRMTLGKETVFRNEASF